MVVRSQQIWPPSLSMSAGLTLAPWRFRQMNELIGRIFSFEKSIFPDSSELYAKLTTDGQRPKALMISCADSRIVPELIMQAQPGDLFVCRNAGNIVPPYATQNGGVSSTVEYAVVALG